MTTRTAPNRQPDNNPTIPIRADLYPAKIVYADGTTKDPVKVLIGLDKIWIYTVNGNAGELQTIHPLDHLTGTLQHGYTATINGKEAHISRSKNCGCGHNKSWKPFNYRLTMTAIPKQ